MLRPQTTRQSSLDLFFSESELPKEFQMIFMLKKMYGFLDQLVKHFKERKPYNPGQAEKESKDFVIKCFPNSVSLQKGLSFQGGFQPPLNCSKAYKAPSGRPRGSNNRLLHPICSILSKFQSHFSSPCTCSFLPALAGGLVISFHQRRRLSHIVFILE